MYCRLYGLFGKWGCVSSAKSATMKVSRPSWLAVQHSVVPGDAKPFHEVLEVEHHSWILRRQVAWSHRWWRRSAGWRRASVGVDFLLVMYPCRAWKTLCSSSTIDSNSARTRQLAIVLCHWGYGCKRGNYPQLSVVVNTCRAPTRQPIGLSHSTYTSVQCSSQFGQSISGTTILGARRGSSTDHTVQRWELFPQQPAVCVAM